MSVCSSRNMFMELNASESGVEVRMERVASEVAAEKGTTPE